MNRFLGFIGVGIFAIAAHSAGTAGSATSNQPASTSGSAAAGTTANAPTPTDADIIQILKTANQAEVDAAKLAMSQAQSKEVKNFAKQMQQEHMKNTQQGEKLAKQMKASPTASTHPRIAEIKTNAQSKMDALKKTSGKEFDSAYINTQVAMHQQVLSDLQNTLIPNAKTDQLKSFLETTRAHVQQHLEDATKLQASLTKTR